MKTSRLILILHLLASSVQANVGGYYRGGVEQSGTLGGFEPSGTDRIRIVHEQLTVQLKPEAADVEVRYVMRNQTDVPVTAHFGFPVAESSDFDGGKPIGKQPRWKEPRQCGGYRIRADDKALKVRYRISTGACWAGTIARGQIVIRPTGINPAEVRVLKPAKRFVKNGNDWVWKFNELEPTLADDIEVEVTPAISYFDNFVGVLGGKENDEGFYQSRNGLWTVTHRSYDVKAGSTLPSEGNICFDATNLADKDPNTVWSEGAVGLGIGEWLELRLRVVKPLDRLRITPGFAGSEQMLL